MDMKKMMEKMKAKSSRKMSEQEKAAKMAVLGELQKEAAGAMTDGLKGLKKVTVAAEDEEGLEAGLEKAQELMKSVPEMMAESEDEEMSEEMEESEEDEEMADMDESEDMDEAELDRRLEKLMALKKKKGLAT